MRLLGCFNPYSPGFAHHQLRGQDTSEACPAVAHAAEALLACFSSAVQKPWEVWHDSVVARVRLDSIPTPIHWGPQHGAQPCTDYMMLPSFGSSQVVKVRQERILQVLDIVCQVPCTTCELQHIKWQPIACRRCATQPSRRQATQVVVVAWVVACTHADNTIDRCVLFTTQLCMPMSV